MCIYDFFANLGNGWVNGATVISAVFGIAFSLFAFIFSIWFSRKLSDSTDKLLQETNQVAVAIRENTDATQLQSAAVHKHTKILRLDNLRHLYELSREGEHHEYWHFRWRFETFDCLSVTVSSADGLQVLGGCQLLIQGFSNEPNHLGFERRASEFYVSRVQNPSASKDQTFPFVEGELVASFSLNSTQLMISKGTDPWSTEPQYRMTIGGLGHSQSYRGIPTADTAKIFPRIKDS